jgi:non-ribosomal peptide synthetase-like protein
VNFRKTVFASVLRDRADERGPETPSRRLHHFFETSCAAAPTSIALECGTERLTYRELDRRASRLADRLLRCGVRPGTRVGILLPRSTILYVALLAVQKAGATFVPIDPAAPADRIGYIADDASLGLLLSTTDLAAGLDRQHRPVLHLEAEDDEAVVAEQGPSTAQEADPACYIIYTSGSTGRPKGVEVSQSSICNFIDVVPGIYGVRREDRVYQGMTLAFDFSIEEIWPTWAVGATVVAGPTDSRRIGSGLAEFLVDNEITVLYCVPTVLATIDRDLPGVHSLLVGGEACPAELVERWAVGGRRMLNTYGPTEATVTATWGELRPGRPVTIGRPLPTYHVRLLDEDLNPVPDGTVGEICIGGPGVARGYLNRPDLTAQRFLDAPRITGNGRLYRTGDLGRRLMDGDIEYLGRADSEVKVRGHRVDLQEIESVMLEDPGVASAAVTLHQAGGGDELAGYLTSHVPGRQDEVLPRLRDTLRRRLPQYMVPTYLDVLDSLPLMPSGKVDRKSLPAPTGKRLAASERPVVAAGTRTERMLSSAWSQVLGLEEDQVSVEADFFLDFGGHSLLAAKAASLLRHEGIAPGVSVADLYRHPTIRQLALHVETVTASAPDRARAERPPRRRHGRGRVAAAGTGQFVALYLLLLLFGLPVAVVLGLRGGDLSAATLWELAIVTTVSMPAARFVLPIIGVRLLAIGIRAGRYPMWGWTHLRLWALQGLLALSPLGTLSGSPLAAPYLRLLGARIGRHTHIATPGLSLPTLIDIGDGASIGYGAQLQTAHVDRGWVTVGPVSVGARAFVGANAVLQPGASVAEDASLAEMSLAGLGQAVPPKEYWAGSPATPATKDDALLSQLRDRPRAKARPGVVAGFAIAWLCLEALPFVLLVALMAVAAVALRADGPTFGLEISPLSGPVLVLVTCLVIAGGKRLVLPSTPPGIHPVESSMGLRKWVADKLLQTSLTTTNSLYATLYTVPWLRALGARIGRRAEVSTASHLDPGLLTLGTESFIADMASVGSATYCNGYLALGRTVVGQRSFVGNAALLRSGTSMADDALVGVHTMAPAEGVPGGTAWLGSPAIRLPRRQESERFPDELTFRPTRARVAERLLIEFFRIVLPGTLVGVAAYAGLLATALLARTGGMTTVILLTPAVGLLAGLAIVLVVAAVKWLVVGRYRPRVEPLWGRFVRRTEFVSALYEAAACPALLNGLAGTPMLGPMLRLFGAKVGRRTWIATTYLTEFDLVRIGDDVAVGYSTSLQTHLFEDRVMKMSHVVLESGSSVGTRSVVLYDSVVGADVSVDALSLVMKGERLPDGTDWSGIPSRSLS